MLIFNEYKDEIFIKFTNILDENRKHFDLSLVKMNNIEGIFKEIFNILYNKNHIKNLQSIEFFMEENRHLMINYMVKDVVSGFLISCLNYDIQYNFPSEYKNEDQMVNFYFEKNKNFDLIKDYTKLLNSNQIPDMEKHIKKELNDEYKIYFHNIASYLHPISIFNFIKEKPVIDDIYHQYKEKETNIVTESFSFLISCFLLSIAELFYEKIKDEDKDLATILHST